MTLERLEELKRQILDDLRSLIHRQGELHDQFAECALEAEIYKMRSVVDVIDAAISAESRQVSGDAEAQEAITVLTEIKRNRMNIGFTIFPNWAQPIKAIEQALDLAISVLSAYRQPVGDEYTYSQCKACGDVYIDNIGSAFCPNCGEAIESED